MLPEQKVFFPAGDISGARRSRKKLRECCFGNNSFDARVDGGGLQRDPGAHGFSEGKDMSGVLGGYEFI
jgi:hypothetical protein